MNPKKKTKTYYKLLTYIQISQLIFIFMRLDHKNKFGYDNIY